MTSEKISDKEYEYSLKFLDRFEIKTMKKYYNLYLKCEVLLLPDVFETFRKSSLRSYGLCSSNYFSASALKWDAMINMTKAELELISGADVYLFFEEGIRGGVSYISKRYDKPNNDYLKSCDPKQEPKQMIYLDANNLYGYARSKFLPTGKIKWIGPKEFDLNKYTNSISKG